MIAIFTNIKNENRYLRQWIDYHAALGFNEFILFEDEGSEPHDDIVLSYNKIHVYLYKEVLHNNSNIFKDLTCFNFVFKRHPEIEWGIKLDPDEYINLNGYKTIQEYIEHCTSVMPASELVMNWHIHNANGLVTPPEGTYDLRKTYPNTISFKSIEENEYASKNCYELPKTLMCFTAFANRSDAMVNEYIAPNFPHRLLVTDMPYDCDRADGVHIEHYITKSFEEYFYRLKNKGEYSPQWFRTLGDFFVLNPDMKDMLPELEKKYNFSIDTFKTKLNVQNIKFQE